MFNNQPSVDRVRVPRVQLLKALRENRDKHRAVFEEAMEGYRTQAIKILEEHIERIKANKPEQVRITLPMPEDHTDDYDRVIQMIEWSLDAEVWLDGHEFDQYVRDEWGWKAAFLATASTYTEV